MRCVVGTVAMFAPNADEQCCDHRDRDAKRHSHQQNVHISCLVLSTKHLVKLDGDGHFADIAFLGNVSSDCNLEARSCAGDTIGMGHSPGQSNVRLEIARFVSIIR